MVLPTIRFRLKKLVEHAFLAAAGLLILSHFLGGMAGTQSLFSVVISGSMEPQVQRGDVIIWVPAQPEDMEVGDVAIFNSYAKRGTVISHRVVEITYKNGEPYFVTKGDNNNYTDQGSGAPEPKVGRANLLGKALTIGPEKRLFKVPYAGWIMLLGTDFFSSLTEHIFDSGSSSFQAGILVPMMGSMGLLVVAVAVLNPRKDEKLEMVQLLFGTEKVRVRRVFAYAAAMFIVFLVSTAFFAFDEISVSIGAGEGYQIPRGEQSRMNFEKIPAGGFQNKSLPINAPALLGVKGLVYATEGEADWVSFNGTLFHVEAKDRLLKEITVTVPENTSKGTYHTTIFIYSSPYWVLLPDDFMLELADWNPKAAVFIFDVLAALVMAVISVIILWIMAVITDTIINWKIYAAWAGVWIHPKLGWLYKRLGGRSRLKKIRHLIHPTEWLKELDWYRFDPLRPLLAGVAATGVGLPLVLAGRSFEAILVAAPLAGMLAYVAGCHYRPQVILAGTVAEGLTMGLGLASAMSLPSGMEMKIMAVFIGELGAIFALLFVVMLLPAAWLSYMGASLLHQVRLRYRPEDYLSVNSDL